MRELLLLLDFDEGSSCTSDVLQVEGFVLEFYLGVVARNAFIEDQNLVGTVPADFGAVFFD
jgi:hypothetical protein